MKELILVLDFGGQYKELIASAVRSLNVYSEIANGDISAKEIKEKNPIGIILTGGPNSVYLEDSLKCDPEIFELGIPILGICYGMQLMCHTLGGHVSSAEIGEYGVVPISSISNSSILKSEKFNALMSHRDHVTILPEGFTQTAITENCIAACENTSKKLYATQFHPEAKHTEGGKDILKSFLYDVCNAEGSYKIDDYITSQIEEIKNKVGDKKVLLALSGGVDSSVCASLISEAIGNQLTCVFVDHGFMRKGEGDQVELAFKDKNLNFIRINAKDRFLSKINGISDPEKKRKLIGNEFIYVFEEEAKRLNLDFLAQGTIYPDIVESGGVGAVIKSHHNVGGLPENLDFEGLIEPLAGLFKDEVRLVGEKLGLPNFIVHRQPFPGPGLAIRIMGEITEESLELLREADAITREELDTLPNKPSQYFAVLTNTKTVGVKGDSRTYDNVVAIRAVITDDFMTAEYAEIPHENLKNISRKITSNLNVSRVVYDITSKPPATVEWE